MVSFCCDDSAWSAVYIICIYYFSFFFSVTYTYTKTSKNLPYRVHPVSFWRHGRMLPDLAIGDACLGEHVFRLSRGPRDNRDGKSPGDGSPSNGESSSSMRVEIHRVLEREDGDLIG